MIREIENRRSIRKYKPDEIERKLIEEIIYSASLAPSAKNRQPWKFIVYQGKEKDYPMQKHPWLQKIYFQAERYGCTCHYPSSL